MRGCLVKRPIVFYALILSAFLNTSANAFEYGSGFDEGDLDLGQNALGFHEKESDPTAPATDEIRIYAKDLAGITTLYTEDADGTVRTLGGLSTFSLDFDGTTFADDQIFIADTPTTGTARTITNCTDSGGNHLNYTQATNSFSCGTTSSGAGGWSDGGTDITLTTSTDNVGIGGASLGKLSIDGDTDESQLLVQGHSTQTSNTFVVETSDGTDLFSIANDGTVTQGGAGTPAMTLGGGTPATYPITFSLSGSSDPVLTAVDTGYKWAAASEDLTSAFTSNTLTNSSSTGVTSIVYTSIGLTTGAASNFSSGTVTLGVLAGTIDAGGATSTEIVNGTGPTVNAAGEIAVDTTDDQVKYYGGAERVLSYKLQKNLSYDSPTASDLIHFWKPADNVTITSINCIVDPAGSGESAVIDIQECDGNGDSCAGVDGATTITCGNTNTADDGALSNATIDAGDWVVLDGGTVTGTVSNVGVEIRYTLDAE